MLDQFVCKTVYGFMPRIVLGVLKGADAWNPERFAVVSDGRYEKWHRPIVDAYVDWIAPDAPGIRSFPLSYCAPTHGSEEAIRELMTYIKEVKNADRIYVLRGEYEGYAAVAGTRGLPCLALTLDGLLEAPPGWVFLSNPSAIDGNILPADDVRAICDRHRVVYDLAYLGTCETGPGAADPIDLAHPNVWAVLTSFSKPFGMFYHRIGFCFAKEPVPSLTANQRWFKNVPGLVAAHAVTRGVDRLALRTTMYAAQERSLDALDAAGWRLHASDSYLLAHLGRFEAGHLGDDSHDALVPYARGPGYRFCLTPSYETLHHGD